jgi:Spy/CpxP family protein refolding chaperone
MHTRQIVLIGLAAASICAAGALAQSSGPAPESGRPCGMHDGSGRLVKLMMRATDLTADQTAQAQQILDAQRAAGADTHTRLRQAKDELASLLLGPQEVTPDALSTQLAHVAELKQELAQRQAATVLALRAILSPEQLAKAAAMKDQMPMHHHKGPCPGNAA